MALRAAQLRPEPGSRSTPRPLWPFQRWSVAASLFVYGLLAILLLRPVWGSPAKAIFGYGPDPPFFIWCFQWLPFALTHGLNPLATRYIDYPAGLNLMASTSAPLLDLLLWPVTATAGALAAYNLAIFAGITLSAWSCFLLCRRLVPNWAAAVTGGAIYGISPFMVAHSLAHPHLVFAFFPPLFFLVGYELALSAPSHPARWGMLLGLMAAAQFYLSEELLTMEVVGGVLAIGAAAALFPGEWISRLRAALVPLGVGIAVCVALTAVPLGIQFLGPQHVIGTVNPPGYYVSDLLGFITPGRLQWLSPAAAQGLVDRFTGNGLESTAYLGLPLLAIAAFTAARFWHRPLVRFSVLLGGMLAVLSLGPTLHLAGTITPIPSLVLGLTVLIGRRRLRAAPVLVVLAAVWVGLAIAPLLHDLLAGRLSLLVILMGSLLVAVFVDASVRFPTTHRIAAGVATVTLLASLAPTASLAATEYAIPGFFRHSIAAWVKPGQTVLVAPYAYGWDDLAMVWQATARMRFKMPEGYGTVPGPSIDPPPTALGRAMMAIDRGGPFPVLESSTRAAWRQDLRRWQVDEIVVGPMDNENAMVQLFTDLTGRAPVRVDGVYLWPSASGDSSAG